MDGCRNLIWRRVIRIWRASCRFQRIIWLPFGLKCNIIRQEGYSIIACRKNYNCVSALSVILKTSVHFIALGGRISHFCEVNHISVQFYWERRHYINTFVYLTELLLEMKLLFVVKSIKFERLIFFCVQVFFILIKICYCWIVYQLIIMMNRCFFASIWNPFYSWVDFSFHISGKRNCYSFFFFKLLYCFVPNTLRMCLNKKKKADRKKNDKRQVELQKMGQKFIVHRS